MSATQEDAYAYSRRALDAVAVLVETDDMKKAVGEMRGMPGNHALLALLNLCATLAQKLGNVARLSPEVLFAALRDELLEGEHGD